MTKTITELCPEHSKKLMTKAIAKQQFYKFICRKCKAELNKRLAKDEKLELCKKHQKKMDDWQERQLDDIICEDCR